MSRREELIELDEDLRFRKLELFNQEFMTTKYALCRRIDDIVRRTERQLTRAPNDDQEARRYYEAKLNNLHEFWDCVTKITLFEILDEWWCYEFAIDSHGSSLFVSHVALAEINDNGHEEWLAIEEYDTRLKIIETKCKLYTVDEFAKARGAAPATVRVWIRRGKIRSAMKTASGWMVPEMTTPFKRGFTDARYEWDVNLGECPDGIEEICEPGSIDIRKSTKKGKRRAWYTSKDRTSVREYELTVPETERLELFLIGHPAVEYTGDQENISQ